MPQRKLSTDKWSILNIRLKHFDGETIRYVLNTTGYNSLIEYEDMCLDSDLFIHSIEKGKGMIISNSTESDYKKFRVFELGIHNLNDEARHYVITNYIDMSQIEYEMKYPERNKLYIIIPYKNEQLKIDSNVVVTNELSSDFELVKKNIDKSDISIDGELNGWSFTKNKQTNNSYVLTPPNKIQLVKDRKVYWGGNVTPTTWHLSLEGLNRPIYFNNTVGGWIVSLSLDSQLINLGAKKI